MKTRVRFAPSPTGALHIGGARTALFNWLFARHTGGEFLLRIEDTDTLRSTKGFEQSILDGMRWLGLNWDGDIVYQSRRLTEYKSQVQKLLAEGKAYPCTCTPEELEAERQRALAENRKPKYDGRCRNGPSHPGRPAAIRFRTPQEGATVFQDTCRGEIITQNTELDDLIILRSDKTPTYNFTVVVDDMDMGITHVIRGDDHINNTPRQIQLYEALGYETPKFAHLPMIHGPDKKKLSKRHGAASVIEYQAMGFVPEAMVNYLARLGWSHGDQEIFTREELCEKFDLSVVGSSPSVFDIEKLRWVNSQHMAKRSDADIAKMCGPFLKDIGIAISDMDCAARALRTERERAKTLKELADMSAFYFRDRIVILPEAREKWLGEEGKKILRDIRAGFEKLTLWDEENIGRVFDDVMKAAGLKMLKVAQPVRVAMTGTTVSPGIYEVLAILGKERVIERINSVLKN